MITTECPGRYSPTVKICYLSLSYMRKLWSLVSLSPDIGSYGCCCLKNLSFPLFFLDNCGSPNQLVFLGPTQRSTTDLCESHHTASRISRHNLAHRAGHTDPALHALESLAQPSSRPPVANCSVCQFGRSLSLLLNRKTRAIWYTDVTDSPAGFIHALSVFHADVSAPDVKRHVANCRFSNNHLFLKSWTVVVQDYIPPRIGFKTSVQ